MTTEATGEGRKLQFCRVMVNFDLPWNPMQIGQRLGRIHRIGQQHDVVARGTVEEHILSVLAAKINPFELVVGELEMILGRIDDESDFARSVFQAHLASRDDAELVNRPEAMGDLLAATRRDHLSSWERNDALIADIQACADAV